MWRNKTVEKLLREHLRREEQLQRRIDELLQQLMATRGLPQPFPDWPTAPTDEELPELPVAAETMIDLG